MQETKKVSALALANTPMVLISFLAYYDIYVVPAKFKRKVKLPKFTMKKSNL